jgi:hypothetical protein
MYPKKYRIQGWYDRGRESARSPVPVPRSLAIYPSNPYFAGSFAIRAAAISFGT